MAQVQVPAALLQRIADKFGAGSAIYLALTRLTYVQPAAPPSPANLFRFAEIDQDSPGPINYDNTPLVTLLSVTIPAVAGDRPHVEGFASTLASGAVEAHFFSIAVGATTLSREVAQPVAGEAGDLYATGSPSWVYTAPATGNVTFLLQAHTLTAAGAGSIAGGTVNAYANLRVRNEQQ